MRAIPKIGGDLLYLGASLRRQMLVVPQRFGYRCARHARCSRDIGHGYPERRIHETMFTSVPSWAIGIMRLMIGQSRPTSVQEPIAYHSDKLTPP